MFQEGSITPGDRVLLREIIDYSDARGRIDNGTIVQVTHLQSRHSRSTYNDGRYTYMFKANDWWRVYEDIVAIERDGVLYNEQGEVYVAPPELVIEGPTEPLGEEHFPIMTGDTFRVTSAMGSTWSSNMRRYRGIIMTSASGQINATGEWNNGQHIFKASDIVEIITRAPRPMRLSPHDKVVLVKKSEGWDKRFADTYGGQTVSILQVSEQNFYIREKLGDRRYGNPTFRYDHIEKVLPREDGYTPNIPYTPKIGDEIILIGEQDLGGAAFPGHWPTSMRRYLGAVGTITQVVDRHFYIKDPNPSIGGFSFKNADALRIATKQDKKDYDQREKDRLELIKELMKTSCIYRDQIGAIATEVFGHDRVKIQGDEEFYSIIVHFPKVRVTNSENRHEDITDMFVKYTINNVNLDYDFRCSIGFQGARTSYTLKQLNSNYTHSHISGLHFPDVSNRGGNTWGNFCLGHSDYRIQMENTRMNIQPEDWGLLFHGLEYYLAWESLEGGPHIRMSGMSAPSGGNNVTVPDSSLFTEVKRMFKEAPFTFWEYTLGDFKLNPDNPMIQEYFNTHSKIRQLYIPGVNDNIRNHMNIYEKEVYDFNGTKFPFTILDQTPISDLTKGSFDPQLTHAYCRILEKEVTSFIKNYIYDNIKTASENLTFAKVRILEQAQVSINEEPVEADQEVAF